MTGKWSQEVNRRFTIAFVIHFEKVANDKVYGYWAYF